MGSADGSLYSIVLAILFRSLSVSHVDFRGLKYKWTPSTMDCVLWDNVSKKVVLEPTSFVFSVSLRIFRSLVHYKDMRLYFRSFLCLELTVTISPYLPVCQTVSKQSDSPSYHITLTGSPLEGLCHIKLYWSSSPYQTRYRLVHFPLPNLGTSIGCVWYVLLLTLKTKLVQHSSWIVRALINFFSMFDFPHVVQTDFLCVKCFTVIAVYQTRYFVLTIQVSGNSKHRLEKKDESKTDWLVYRLDCRRQNRDCVMWTCSNLTNLRERLIQTRKHYINLWTPSCIGKSPIACKLLWFNNTECMLCVHKYNLTYEQKNSIRLIYSLKAIFSDISSCTLLPRNV